ncbi:iron-containing alcohol dehydrogenase [uncultured Treponema sp.]|uniref:iron-containing alcohol dehydrogenase n=1 Tax=uncultured Treponema sp. TaxID=162155 RepID=UPI002597215F|nr:iron-containing alcohol dehydrogenase [uncultured Treponema sp.]
MTDFIFKISPNIILGPYTVTRLGQNALEWGSRYMIIMDPILKETGTAEKITAPLAERKIEYFVFDELTQAADTQTLETILNLARNSHIHGIIAAGGGKTLALAKAACALFNEPHTSYDYIDGGAPTAGTIPLICVPTTIRDAFLFTDRVPLCDSRSGSAKIIKTQNGICKLVLWDPNLELTLTDKQNAAMGLETFSMALEAYLSRKSTFFSDMLIEKALQLMSYATDGSPTLTVTTPPEVLYTQAGCMASLGLASCSAGASTLLSLTINTRYKIPRALVSAILLPYIIEDATTFAAAKLAKIADIYRITDSNEDTDEKKALSLAEYIRQRIAKINIPARLKDLSLSIEQLSLAVEDAGQTDLIDSLQRSMTTDDLFELIKKAY